MEFLSDVLNRNGSVRAGRLSGRLGVSRAQLAAAAGLSGITGSGSAQLDSSETQARLRDIAEIMNRVQAWAGSEQIAFAWYRSQPLPGFGDMTAEDLVKQGRAEVVKQHLSRIAAGGYA